MDVWCEGGDMMCTPLSVFGLACFEGKAEVVRHCLQQVMHSMPVDGLTLHLTSLCQLAHDRSRRACYRYVSPACPTP